MNVSRLNGYIVYSSLSLFIVAESGRGPGLIKKETKR